MRLANIVLAALLAMAIMSSESIAANNASINDDGWHTWQLDATGPITEMCCFSQHRRSRAQKGCNLDGRRISFGSGGDCAAEAGNVQVYTLIENGRPTKIRVLSSECPVSTESELTNHGVVTANDNVEWFRRVIEDDRTGQEVREAALFGLVQSESDAAYDYIDRLLSRRP